MAIIFLINQYIDVQDGLYYESYFRLVTFSALNVLAIHFLRVWKGLLNLSKLDVMLAAYCKPSLNPGNSVWGKNCP